MNPLRDPSAAEVHLGWPCTVAELECALFGCFPRAWAEGWDRVGLAVGDPDAAVAAVAVALDATPAAIVRAAELGANVLVTHHPVCLAMPDVVSPGSSGAPLAAAAVWEAVVRGVALVAMHTNLDRSERACGRLPRLLGLDPVCGLERGRAAGTGGLGAVADLGAPVAVDELARRCQEAFGRVAQVYGDGGRGVRRVAFFTGSLGDGGQDALAVGADAVVCGECGYHRALDLAAGGHAVILLGHDASELPLADVLAETLVEFGVPSERCLRIEERPVWHHAPGAGE